MHFTRNSLPLDHPLLFADVTRLSISYATEASLQIVLDHIHVTPHTQNSDQGCLDLISSVNLFYSRLTDLRPAKFTRTSISVVRDQDQLHCQMTNQKATPLSMHQ
ncbi:hypothetical protein EUGRSUZ_H04211 [Eucalyptus grandis]|uniref:Uncharacterized protein n=2 Tax=Eucalyptus grandis TaxID=71139 RepID=A0ACC3JX13_EUCGR|nr:hypothetical protein EUGRSUZ_H04211 [Eucalyptus grandis]